MSVIVDAEREGSIVAPPLEGHAAVASRTAAHLLASAVARARTAARRIEDAPVRSRVELLTEFLLGSRSSDRLLTLMRAADLAVDGWHAAVQVEIDNLHELADGEELRSFQLYDRVSRIAMEAAHATGGVWHRAQLGSALLLVRMSRSNPGARSGLKLADAGRQIVDRVVAGVPGIKLICGVGSMHNGSLGLRTTAAEARSAVAAGRAAGRINQATAFDEVGLQRTLLDWYASDSAREAVQSVLAPLNRLDARKRDTAIKTLRVYLDEQGSLVRTAQALHLHRNAVAYRLKRIFGELEVDIDDPDTRLMLQLACRSQSFT